MHGLSVILVLAKEVGKMLKRVYVLLVLVLLVVGFIGLAGEEPKYGGTLRFAQHGDVKQLHPWVAVGAYTYNLHGNVYSGLVTYEPPTGEIGPELAVAWDRLDDITYVFYLRVGVTFHSGHPFMAEDVKYSLEQMIAEDSLATFKADLDIIDTIDVLGPYTVKITLKQPSGAFLAILASPAVSMISKAWMEEGHDLATEMNGTGPFKFVSHEPGVKTIVAKNEDYFKPGRPYLDEIVLLVYKDPSARTNALKGGEVNFIEYVPWEDMDFFEASPDFRLEQGYNPFMFVRMNINKAPFDDRLVRLAISYAVDREELIDLAWGGKGLPIRAGLIYPGTYYYNEDMERWTYNPDKAIALLKEAGYDDPSELSFTMLTMNLTIHQDTAEIIQSQLARLGIDCSLEVVEPAVATGTRYSPQGEDGYQAATDGQSFYILEPSGYSNWFKCGAHVYANAVGFCDEELDKLLEQGLRESDPEKRKEIYRAYEERLLYLAPWVFLYWRPQGEAMALYVKGYERHQAAPIGILSTAHMENIWLDK